jgi:hypothetical protein
MSFCIELNLLKWDSFNFIYPSCFFYAITAPFRIDLILTLVAIFPQYLCPLVYLKYLKKYMINELWFIELLAEIDILFKMTGLYRYLRYFPYALQNHLQECRWAKCRAVYGKES